jgi:hypothetical protein
MALFWDVAPCSLAIIALTMEAESTFETSVKFYYYTAQYPKRQSYAFPYTIRKVNKCLRQCDNDITHFLFQLWERDIVED